MRLSLLATVFTLALSHASLAAAQEYGSDDLSFAAREYINELAVREALAAFSTRELLEELKGREVYGYCVKCKKFSVPDGGRCSKNAEGHVLGGTPR
ncbi:hypothetical protein DFP72DRAFT_1078535 [Ephemerocybe angulata]|uniref:Uncharacterized protein n=1 Tax=Ephemerocybe angulata TaxID=980116 RepID=A0A8H6LXP8_9AGAR|nr:hypothetical protein DFP72DRAFT_1078535 [Tulosesus angulatus]